MSEHLYNADEPTRIDRRCPCCGNRTLSRSEGFELCRVCWWENDGQGDHDADDVRGGPNGDISLTQARANYRKFGASHEKYAQHCRVPRVYETRPLSPAEAMEFRSEYFGKLQAFDTLSHDDIRELRYVYFSLAEDAFSDSEREIFDEMYLRFDGTYPPDMESYPMLVDPDWKVLGIEEWWHSQGMIAFSEFQALVIGDFLPKLNKVRQ